VPKVKVVELRGVDEKDLTEDLKARFVLASDGKLYVRKFKPNPILEDINRHGIPGRSRVLKLRDGIEFMERLSQVYAGTYLYATEIFEMDESEALK
jgi:hypothetical protein